MNNLAATPVKINEFEMSTNATRRRVQELIAGGDTLLEVGAGTGAMSLDFLLNGGKYACMIEQIKEHGNACAYNALLNKIPEDNYKILNISAEEFVEQVAKDFNDQQDKVKKYDRIIIGSAWITNLEVREIIKSSLKKGGVICGIIHQRVLNNISSLALKEVATMCNMHDAELFLDTDDGNLRIIYHATYN